MLYFGCGKHPVDLWRPADGRPAPLDCPFCPPLTHECANPRCREVFRGKAHPLCPSCRWIGQVGFAVGSLLAGLVAGLLKVFL